MSNQKKPLSDFQQEGKVKMNSSSNLIGTGLYRMRKNAPKREQKANKITIQMSD